MSMKHPSPDLPPPANLEFVRQEGDVSIIRIGETIVRVIGGRTPNAFEPGSVVPGINELGDATVSGQVRRYIEDLNAETEAIQH